VSDNVLSYITLILRLKNAKIVTMPAKYAQTLTIVHAKNVEMEGT